MAAYDSDSSGVEDVETGVTLGYTSKDPTGDDFSQLGGNPTWLDDQHKPDAALAKCSVCNSFFSLLLQLHADLPERYPGHERRLYLFGCRSKTCRRKDGSIRGLRYTRVNKDMSADSSRRPVKQELQPAAAKPNSPSINLGSSLFGGGANNVSTSANPFGPASGPATANPFAATNQSSVVPPLTTETLAETFAQKVSVSLPKKDEPISATPSELWPEEAAFPKPYPRYHIDADKEFLDPEPDTTAQRTQITNIDEGESSAGGSSAEDKNAFESTMDKTFQRFADRLAQNPEQILRYEHEGQPLLYSKTDKIGKAWPRITRCKCGGERSFELQLTPHAIDELESEDLSLEGMDWGTVIFASCKRDCEGWSEEWVGVQWEEMVKK